MASKKLSRVMASILCVSVIFGSIITANAADTANSGKKSTPAEMISGADDKLAAFYAGKVVQSFSPDESSLEVDKSIDTYVDEDKTLITSTTKELTWDYGNGITKVDTDMTQSVTGFLKQEGKIELKDVEVISTNEYGTILVTSLDNKPIASSEKLLVQASTEDKFYGFKEEDGVIKNLGDPLLLVKEIEATVSVKNEYSLKAVVLDANGYVKSETNVTNDGGRNIVKLPADSLYTVLYREGAVTIPPAPESVKQDYIWWEGEKPYDTNFPEQTQFSASTFPNNNYLLSNSDWLTSSGEARKPGETPLYAKYEVNVDNSGEFTFWARKFWQHGPFRWRFDDSDWNVCGTDITLMDSVGIRQFLCVNWVILGNVNLSEGKHTFELELLTKEGEDVVAAFDAFLLTKGFFVPRGNLKPDQSSNKSEEGYFTFEPETDTLSESLIDLRYLNEEVAGQSGHVKSDNKGHLTLGNGKPVKFMSVNLSNELVNSDKKTVDYLAKRLAKYGVNLVRIHGLAQNDPKELMTVSDEFLDRLQYFVYAMKNQGIYCNLSWYFPLWYQLNAENGFAEYNNTYPFALLQFDKQFQDIYKKTATKLFTSNSKYTGLSIAEEPAVMMIEIQNEDNYFFWTFSRGNIAASKMQILDQLFGSWLIKKYGSLENALSTWGEGSGQELDSIENNRMMVLDVFNITSYGMGTGSFRNRMSDQLQFLVENQKQFYSDMVSFYKNELKAKCLFSASNWTTADNKTLNALERYTYTPADVIDRHAYFNSEHTGDGSSYSVQLGHSYVDRTALFEPESAVMGYVETEGYPQMVSETGWTNPNRFKGESVPLWTAYGSLNGMDAINFFSLGSPHWETDMRKFPLVVPSIMGQFPGFSLMYRRQDVKESEPLVKVKHSLKELYDFKGSPIYEESALDQYRDTEKHESTDEALFNFEHGRNHGFTNIDGFVTVEVVQDIRRAFNGKGSLNIKFKDALSSKNASGEIIVGIKDPQIKIPAGSEIKFNVYVPGNTTVTVQPFIIGGAYITSTEVNNILLCGKWIEIPLKVEQGIPDVKQIGIKIGIPKGAASDGQIWIDTISYDGYSERAALEISMKNAETIYNNAVIGDLVGQYPQAAKDELNQSILEIKTIIDDYNSSKALIIEGSEKLKLALDKFYASRNTIVDEAYLNFEDGLGDFGKRWGGGTSTVTLDNTKSYAGKNSVRIDVDGNDTFGIQKDISDIPFGSTLKFRFYISPGTTGDIQVMIFGKDWAFNGEYKSQQDMPTGEWFEIPIVFKEGGIPIVMLGFSAAGTSKGTIWVDSIEVIPPTE